MNESETKLVRMAQEIRQFFRRRDDAAEATADHLRQFWAPAMRAEFRAAVARDGDAMPEEIRAIAQALAALET